MQACDSPLTPSLLHVRMTLQAISPLLAMRILSNGLPTKSLFPTLKLRALTLRPLKPTPSRLIIAVKSLLSSLALLHSSQIEAARRFHASIVCFALVQLTLPSRASCNGERPQQQVCSSDVWVIEQLQRKRNELAGGRRSGGGSHGPRPKGPDAER